jgi:solute carrier family 25 protein 44
MYSALTVALHPLTVAKIRRQVARNGQPTGSSSHKGAFLDNIGQYYRGLGVVVGMAIPARIIYISTLEYTREKLDTSARQFLSNPPPTFGTYSKEMSGLLPMVTPFSGGISGGLAAVSSQVIVVPMDVVSQKLMVMEEKVYQSEGSAMMVARSIIRTDGWQGLYRGFGLSLLTSLPAGTIWWGTYSGLRDKLSVEDDREGYIPRVARPVVIQVASAFGAAMAASLATQPLDTIKTRLQVGANDLIAKPRSSMGSIGNFTPGLYKGLLPRIVHMGVWGSVLSAAYEVLKLVSRKDYDV